MTIVLGFGSTEAEERIKIKEYLSIHGETDEWNKKADIYDKMPQEEAPERYTKFYILDNKIKFYHINRRHPFSPDGWALMIIEEPFGVAEDN